MAYRLELAWMAAFGGTDGRDATHREISVQQDAGIARKNILVEQGKPVPPMAVGEIAPLALLDENGATIPAEIEAHGTDPKSHLRWISYTDH
jgi:hypothetical protein